MDSLKLFFQWFYHEVSLLSILVISVTVILLYFYVIEKSKSRRLTRKYRESLYENQSKSFLNAVQYLISGNKQSAINEFLMAVENNRDALEAHFALGRLFRANGEIEKAIAIHRSLIARHDLGEGMRLIALKELALDFDKSGLKDKAIETYKDVLKINKEQPDVILNLCRIYEDVADWDEALNYRLLLSKVSRENQAETLSHIITQQANSLLNKGEYKVAFDKVEDALKFAPSVSAKILKIKLLLILDRFEEAQLSMEEVIKLHSAFTSFLFLTLEQSFRPDEIFHSYLQRLGKLKDAFLEHSEFSQDLTPSLLLSRVRILESKDDYPQAASEFEMWIANRKIQGDAMRVEYMKTLRKNGRDKECLEQLDNLVQNLQTSSTRHFCSQCGYSSDDIFWRCPQCYTWESIQFRWKV